MRFVAKIARHSLADFALLGEAFFLLALARLALRMVPVRVLDRYFSRSPEAALPKSNETVLRRVRWAVTAAARRAPIQFVCFPQAITAQGMLRRRGIASTIYYGVAHSSEGELEAHVWLMTGDRYVVGGESAANFRVLKTFPAAPPQSADLASSLVG
jgi:hypothetical protein